MFKKLITVSAGVVLASGLAACGGSSSDGGSGGSGGSDKITMGFAQVGAESGWRTANTKSIQETAKDEGVDLKFSDAQQKQENQIKAIRSYIQQKVDVIAFSPVVETGWDAVLQEAKARQHPGDPRPTARSTPRTRRSTRRSSARTSSSRARRPASGWSTTPTTRTSTATARSTSSSSQGTDRLRSGHRPREGLRRRHQGRPERSRSSPRRPATSPATAARRSWRASCKSRRRHRPGLRAQRRHGPRRHRGDRGRRLEAGQGHQDHHDRRGQGRHAGARPTARSTTSSSATRCSVPQLMDLAKKVARRRGRRRSAIVTEETTFTQEQATEVARPTASTEPLRTRPERPCRRDRAGIRPRRPTLPAPPERMVQT